MSPTTKRDMRRVWMRTRLGWHQIQQDKRARCTFKALRFGFFALVLGYLTYKLTQLGWRELLTSLPSNPWFYVFFTLRFFALPVSELIIYQIVWETPLVKHFPVFVRKRVYNYAVMGYSGEAFLALWARRNLNLSDKKVFVGVKDNNLLSAFSSNAATVILLVILAATGGLSAGLSAFPGATMLFGLAFLSAFILSMVVVFFHGKIIASTGRTMAKLLGVHGGRQIILIILHTAMYACALPGAPMMAWLTFIALQLVISRIPFLPNQDIVYLGAALSLAPIVASTEAEIAAMLLTEAGLSQLYNAALFLATASLARDKTPAVKISSPAAKREANASRTRINALLFK